VFYTEATPFFPVRNGLRCKTVAFNLEALQVLGESHLEAEDFQVQIGLLQQGLSLPSVLGPDQGFQQIVQVAFDAFAQHEAMVAGKFAGMVARPETALSAIILQSVLMD
jgi:hypothetical protein